MNSLRLPLRYVVPLLLFIAFFMLYASGAAPELDWGDAGESQLAIQTAGLSHPTGYPLFLMVGWLWSHLLGLVGIAPTRAITLFSVASGAAAIACMVPATNALMRRTLPADTRAMVGILPGILVAVIFGLSPTFWSQSFLAEVYAFHILLLVLFLWALWSETPRWGLAAFLYGVFLSHHRTAILWAPGLLLWLWLEQRQLFQPRAFLRLMALVLLPQLAYLYIPIRGVVTPYLHQALGTGQTLNLYDGSWQAFVAHILGTVFAADVGLREPLAARLGRVWGLLILNVSFFALIPLLLGVLRRKAPSNNGKAATTSSSSRADLLLLASGTLFTLLFGLFYAIGDVEVMFIPAWLGLLWLAMLGLLHLITITPRVGAFVGFWVVVLVIIARLPYAPESRADHTAPRELVNTFLEANPSQGAILVTNDRNEMVPFWYVQFAEGQRQDILGLFPLITPNPEHATAKDVVEWALQFNRPIYLTKPMPGLALRYNLQAESESTPLVRVLGGVELPTTPLQESDLTPDLTVTAWEPPPTLEAGQQVFVGVALTPQQALADDLSLSLQLFDANGAFLAQQDIAPDVFYPPSAWTPQETVRPLFSVTLPDTLPEGGISWRLSAYVLKEGEDYRGVGRQVLLGTTR